MSLNPCDCDWDSEFDFRWNGPSSICDWSCKVLLLAVYSSVTCFEIIFCGRWRDCLPLPPPAKPVQEDKAGDKETEMNELDAIEKKGGDDTSTRETGESTVHGMEAGDEKD